MDNMHKSCTLKNTTQPAAHFHLKLRWQFSAQLEYEFSNFNIFKSKAVFQQVNKKKLLSGSPSIPRNQWDIFQLKCSALNFSAELTYKYSNFNISNRRLYFNKLNKMKSCCQAHHQSHTTSGAFPSKTYGMVVFSQVEI